MPLLERKKVLAAVLEDEAGVIPSGNPLDDVSNMRLGIESASLEPDIESVENPLLRDTLTPAPGLTSFKRATLSVRHALRGPNDADGTAVPAWGRFLEACGMRRAVTHAIELTGAVGGGPFRHGEIVVGGTSGARGRVLHDAYSQQGYILIEPISGTWSTTAEQITGESTGASANTVPQNGGVDPTDPDVGYTWYPTSIPVSKIAVDTVTQAMPANVVIQGQTSGAVGLTTEALSAAGDLKFRSIRGTFQGGEQILEVGGTGDVTATTGAAQVFDYGGTLAAKLFEDGVAKTVRGCRGTPTFEFNAGGQAFVAYEFRGVWVATADVANPTGVDIEGRTPPLLQSIPITVADDAMTTVNQEVDPGCWSQLTATLNATVSQRTCAQDAGGIREMFISDRAGTISLDPDATVEADFDWITKLVNAETARLRMGIGSSAKNRFLVSMPGIRLTSAARGGRDGALTTQIEGELSGGPVGNLNGANVAITNPGSDNEFVLTYFHTVPSFI